MSTVPASTTGSASKVASIPIDTMSACDVVKAIVDGTYSCESIMQAYLNRIQERDQILNSFVTVDAERALAAAREVDQRRATPAGLKAFRPLEGLPIVAKDNIIATGFKCTAGTPGLKDFYPKENAPVLQKLLDAGAILVGKVNMHELAFGITGYNPSYNTNKTNIGVRNSYNPQFFAGGSSSGTGAAVGARLAPAGLGTDTGASVRLPASVNGLCGLRPTIQRYSQYGIVPLSHSRDTAGPMCVSMEDVELLDRVIMGSAVAEPIEPASITLGIMDYFLQNLDADTRLAFDQACARMKEAGIKIVQVTEPNLISINLEVGLPLLLYEAYDDLVAFLDHHKTGVTIDEVVKQIASPDVKEIYEGLVVPRKVPTATPGTLADGAPAYAHAIKRRPALLETYSNLFSSNKIDALIFPCVPTIPMKASQEACTLPNLVAFIQNTDPGSNAGIPGVVLPMSLGETSGLPIGLELDGPYHSDRRLIGIGRTLQTVLGRIPPPKWTY